MDIPGIVVPTIAIAGTDARFPVRRIFCVGQNYADHAREMGSNPDRQTPFFFTKPADAVTDSGATLPFPPRTADLHHEVELVVALGAGGREIAVDEAPALIFGHAVGLDLTRRDLQAEAKKTGRPWDMGKGFDHSAPVGALTPGAPRLTAV
jgi:fumarylpyruvate hydrolase